MGPHQRELRLARSEIGLLPRSPAEVTLTVDTKQTDQDELEVEATQERSACQHHWVIDPPSGPISKGTCRCCGEEREFQNYHEGARWNIQPRKS